jgi:hypothetical protein
MQDYMKSIQHAYTVYRALRLVDESKKQLFSCIMSNRIKVQSSPYQLIQIELKHDQNPVYHPQLHLSFILTSA